MSAVARLSRLLALVPWLAAHPEATLPQAAAHFGITEAQLEQDLNTIVCSGLPGHGPDQLIDIDFWNEDGSIRVIDDQGLSAPLRLTSSEVTSLLVGLRILEQVPGDHDRSAMVSVAAKLAALAPGYADDVIVTLPGAVAEDLLAAVDAALRQGSAMEITYAGATREEVTERVIWPRAVTVDGGRTYVTAWCSRAGAVRSFRVDRIVSWRATDEQARKAEEPAGAETSTYAVRVAVEPDAEWFLTRHRAVPTGTVGEGILQVHDVEWIVRAVVGLGGSVRVLEPAQVVSRVREFAGAALAAYQSPSASSMT